MSKLLIAVGVVVGLAVLATAAGILSNRPPLTDPPGVLARLLLYVSRNVAQTGAGAALPELRPVLLAGTRDAMLDAVADACRRLGWRNVRVDAAAGTVDAEVVTAVLRFTDDVHVALHDAGDGAVEAVVRSASRIGRGDLGANARHVMDLRAALDAAGVIAPDPS